jgi:CP family cyanate transporter-like MFS transporter
VAFRSPSSASPSSTGRVTPTPAAGGALVLTAIVLVALNLRSPIVATSSVIGEIQVELGMSAPVAGLLTSLPVLCFALATPPASWAIGRFGLDRAVMGGMVVIAVGTVVRSSDGVPGALVGTVLIGIGITVGNIAVPVVIGRDFPDRSTTMLGVYTAAMNVGSVITLALTVPIAGVTGWRWALAAWVIFAVLALGGWGLVTRRNTAARAAPVPVSEPGDEVASTGPTTGVVWWRRPPVWLLMIGFGGQAFTYYGITAWMPEILSALRGLDAAAAGLASTIFQVTAVAGAFTIPVVRAKANSLRVAFGVVAACWLALPLGLLVAPGGWAVWTGLGGFAQGGGFTVIFSAVLAHARDLVENRRMSATVQGGGYVLAATGPTAVGAVHEATGGWTGPLILVTGSLSVLAVAGLSATGGIRAQGASARPA